MCNKESDKESVTFVAGEEVTDASFDVVDIRDDIK